MLEVFENQQRVKFTDLGLGESICAASAKDGSGYMWGGAILVIIFYLTLGTGKSNPKRKTNCFSLWWIKSSFIFIKKW